MISDEVIIDDITKMPIKWHGPTGESVSPRDIGGIVEFTLRESVPGPDPLDNEVTVHLTLTSAATVLGELVKDLDVHKEVFDAMNRVGRKIREAENDSDGPNTRVR